MLCPALDGGGHGGGQREQKGFGQQRKEVSNNKLWYFGHQAKEQRPREESLVTDSLYVDTSNVLPSLREPKTWNQIVCVSYHSNRTRALNISWVFFIPPFLSVCSALGAQPMGVSESWRPPVSPSPHSLLHKGSTQKERGPVTCTL